MRVLLPLKEFAAAKQRLAGVLSAVERAHLFQAMVDDVLNVLTAHPAIDDVVICSRDHAAIWLARYYEVAFLHEDKLQEDKLHEDKLNEKNAQRSDLNSVVNAALQRFATQGLRDVLVVHGDLPLLSAADISVLIDTHVAVKGAAVTIAPDRRGVGTNLLALRPLEQFTARYGFNSFQQHCAQARALGATLSICDLPGARCDIDEPEDLLLLLSQRSTAVAPSTLAYLHSSGIAARLPAMAHAANLDCGDVEENDEERAEESIEVGVSENRHG